MQPYRPFDSASFAPSHTPQSPSYEKETHIGNSEAVLRLQREAADGVLREYGENQTRLAKAIESSLYLLGDLRNFNGNQWTIRYPHLRTTDGKTQALPHRPGMAKRTLTFADEPSTSTDVVLNSVPTRQSMKRSLTIAPDASVNTITNESADDESQANADDFSILRLDLNMGAARHAKGLISHLEKSSISSLLDNRIAASLDHLALLQKRVHDPHSRVLVTGDLNAGKSTLINALLRRHEVMPTDQQPLTTRFVEVVSAKENQDREEIHVLHDGKYDPTDASTFTVETIDQLEAIATDYETDSSAPPLRVFLKEAVSTNPSILHNGIVDISLIDAPGLNRDSIKTTANFARQEEIDVVVFVVSAANHFTLSAKEFIWQAGHEKAHLFIVVNRFDQIRDKERCRRAVLDQIKQLSPKTHEDAADLVHFVDSAKVALGCADDADEDLDEAFSNLEHSLRSFVLVNRAKSKLGPAQNYVTHLLADVELLASANALVATKERETARDELSRVKPVLEELKRGKEGLEEGLVAEEERATSEARQRTLQAMTRGLERVGRGELAVPAEAANLVMPLWTGILGAWDYAKETRRVMLASLDFAAGLAEHDARRLTSEGVERVALVGDKCLPPDVERSKRVFNPSAMFATRPPSRRATSGAVVPLNLGLGLVTRRGMTDVSFSDIIDIQHQLFIARAHLPSSSSSSSSSSTDLTHGFIAAPSSLGAASLAVGALTMSSKVLGARQVIDAMLRVADIANHPFTRKWLGPAIAACGAGAVIWIVYDLPQSIPRNVGRRVQATLLVSGTGEVEDDANGSGTSVTSVAWTEAQAERISREVRKVMRLASWDVRERFRAAVDEKGEVVRESEEVEKRAGGAIRWFGEVEKRVNEIREQVGIKV